MSNETLNIIITAVIVPTLAALIPLLVAFLNAKTNEVKKKVDNEKLNAYVDIAEDAVETAVVSVAQTFVDTLKKQGNFDEEAQRIAFKEAKNKAIAIMGSSARDALAQAYGDLDAWIENKIEYYVKVEKNDIVLLSPPA
jgi:predicted histidine transporter YuiF (NhaC family)